MKSNVVLRKTCILSDVVYGLFVANKGKNMSVSSSIHVHKC